MPGHFFLRTENINKGDWYDDYVTICVALAWYSKNWKLFMYGVLGSWSQAEIIKWEKGISGFSYNEYNADQAKGLITATEWVAVFTVNHSVNSVLTVSTSPKKILSVYQVFPGMFEKEEILSTFTQASSSLRSPSGIRRVSRVIVALGVTTP